MTPSRDALPIANTVGRQASNNSKDVFVIQTALSLLKPDSSSSPYYSGTVDGRSGPQTEAAIAHFQMTHRDKATGRVSNDDLTHRRIVEAVKKELDRKPKPPRAHLEFNGTRLIWRGQPFDGKSWPAVSGTRGYQSKFAQNKEDLGPIPEGRWKARQDRYQKIEDIDSWNRFKSWLGGGAWPGLEESWGSHRVWLDPHPTANIYGRSGFSIHGGDFPGSAGCIDLTFSMNNFGAYFRHYGADMDLFVRYPETYIDKFGPNQRDESTYGVP